MTQTIVNLGTGGAVLNGRNGSTTGADSNDALFLDWTGENYVYLPGVAGNFLSVPDEAALDITGDIDIRVQVAADDWTPASQNTLVSKWGAQASFQFTLMSGSGPSASGSLRLTWVDSGGTTRTANTGVTLVPAVDGETLWVRVALDVDDGAGNNVATFFTSTDGVNWSTLSTVTQAFTTSIFSGNATLRVGSREGDLTAAGKFYRAQVFNGIGGTKVLDVDTSVLTTGAATSFLALTGQTVTINRSTDGRKSVAVVSPCWLFGTDDYMEVANNALLNFGASDSFTIVAVVRQWATQGAFLPYVTKRSVAGDLKGWSLFAGSSSATITGRIDDGPNGVGTTQATFIAGTSQVLAVRVNRTTQNIDAYSTSSGFSATASIATVGDLSTALPVRVGRQSDGSAYQDFELLAVAVFRRALTATEISRITTYYQARLS